VDSAAGYASADITNGLVRGQDWFGLFTGRLTRGPNAGTAAYGNTTVYGEEIDSRPLWDYLSDTIPAASLPLSCVAARTEDAQPLTTIEVLTANAQLKLCLADPTVANTVLFVDDLPGLPVVPGIGQSPRLVAAPQYWETIPLSSNACCYTIKDFVPIFIQGIWARDHASQVCTGTIEVTPSGCIHRPGETGVLQVSNDGQRKVDSASAILIRCEQLPIDVCTVIREAGGPRDLTGMYDLQLTR
jgi:hypothetical protein